MADERYATVDVYFSIDGIVGRERYADVLVVDSPQPLIGAWCKLEMELIGEGLPTFECCGCCLSPESGVELLELCEVVP